MSDGTLVTRELVHDAIRSELNARPGTPNKQVAADLFADMMTRSDFQEFLTTAAYARID